MGGQAVIKHSVCTFLSLNTISPVVVVIHPDDDDLCQAALGECYNRVKIVNGGDTRQESTLRGLEALRPFSPSYVHIHDAARPFVTAAQIKQLESACSCDNGALLALEVTDTVKRGDDDLWVRETLPRSALYAAQTPQTFPFQPILAAHLAATKQPHINFTDDCGVAEWFGIAVKIVKGSPDNVKITWTQDFNNAEIKLLDKDGMLMPSYPDVRVGNGYDVHRFTNGDSLTLCGIKIPFHKALLGHSDADVGLHALTDALFATCGAGDIGVHFPPSEARWKGVASDIFLKRATDLVKENHGRIANIDLTIIAEEPKLNVHRATMVARLQELLEISPQRISIKATTNEQMGFIGRQEGIAVIATVSVVFSGEVPQ